MDYLTSKTTEELRKRYWDIDEQILELEEEADELSTEQYIIEKILRDRGDEV